MYMSGAQCLSPKVTLAVGEEMCEWDDQVITRAWQRHRLGEQRHKALGVDTEHSSGHNNKVHSSRS